MHLLIHVQIKGVIIILVKVMGADLIVKILTVDILIIDVLDTRTVIKVLKLRK